MFGKLKNIIKLGVTSKIKYTVLSFTLPFKIWIWEMMPELMIINSIRVDSSLPRMTRWRQTKKIMWSQVVSVFNLVKDSGKTVRMRQNMIASEEEKSEDYYLSFLDFMTASSHGVPDAIRGFMKNEFLTFAVNESSSSPRTSPDPPPRTSPTSLVYISVSTFITNRKNSIKYAMGRNYTEEYKMGRHCYLVTPYTTWYCDELHKRKLHQHDDILDLSKFKINNEQFKINNEQFEFKIQTPKMDLEPVGRRRRKAATEKREKCSSEESRKIPVGRRRRKATGRRGRRSGVAVGMVVGAERRTRQSGGRRRGGGTGGEVANQSKKRSI
ncbi:hypothetical protein LXL04_016054 [Taraxacum kok-saghyz]